MARFVYIATPLIVAVSADWPLRAGGAVPRSCDDVEAYSPTGVRLVSGFLLFLHGAPGRQARNRVRDTVCLRQPRMGSVRGSQSGYVAGRPNSLPVVPIAVPINAFHEASSPVMYESSIARETSRATCQRLVCLLVLILGNACFKELKN